jgi:copper(I)-binding protein
VACGAGQQTQTAEQVTAGAIADVGELTLADVAFRFDRPVPGDEVHPVGATAPLTVTIVNHGDAPDRLVRVSSPVAGGSVFPDALVIPAGRTVTAGQADTAAIETSYEEGGYVVALVGLREPLRSGVSYPVVFGFERAGDVRVDVPVATPDIPRRDVVAPG